MSVGHVTAAQVVQSAVITGGAAGIGAAYAWNLAAKGYQIVIIDKDIEGAQKLTGELNKTFNVAAEAWGADLTNPLELTRTEDRIRAMPHPSYLINNAGFGTNSTFVDAAIERQVDMVNLHVIATVRLCHAVLPTMIAQKGGCIINVASMAAMTRWPKTAVYCGSKLFLIGFSESLMVELVDSGIAVQALCPGQTRSGFFDTPDMMGIDLSRIPRVLWMPAEQVVALSLRALDAGSSTYVPGIKNRLFIAIFGNKAVQVMLGTLRKWGLNEFILSTLRLVTRNGKRT